MRHAPPVVGLALAFAAGAAWAVIGGPWWVPPLTALLLALTPIRLWTGPKGAPFWLAGAVLAGALSGNASMAKGDRCGAPDPARLGALEGRFLASPRAGSAPFERADGCGTVTVVLDSGDAPAGRGVRLAGRWREGRRGYWFAADRFARTADPEDRSIRWAAVRWRNALAERVVRIYGDQAPMVTALTLARREGFDPELRRSFARTGLAHLLAISGFHVGVITGLLYAFLMIFRVSRRRARLGAVAAAWGYVALIGFPDAACRAALILAFVALSRAGGRPPARWGALSSALLVLLVLDPRRIMAVGFQLSFAGAAGLMAWSRPVKQWMVVRAPPWLPESLPAAVSAGVAATLGTLPIVAWHFEQVSIVGVPATLLAGPLVALALPGAIASMAMDFVSPDAAGFLGGGVGWLLLGLERGTVVLGSLPWASAWTTRASVAAITVGVLVAAGVARRPWIGRRGRRLLIASYGLAGITVWPVVIGLQGRDRVEVLVIDVGQGDAVAIRGPDGAWMLVDAGPPEPSGDLRAHPVVRALRSRGVRRLRSLVLTHADVDHVGGAGAVLRSFPVDAVYDPALPAGKEAYLEALDVARVRAIPWRAATAGMSLSMGDVVVEVVSPTDSLIATDPEANVASVVLLVRFGDFETLLTGDAYRPLERSLAASLPTGVEVLKVGHHGSDTSTDPLLLDRLMPELALISVGRRNRYGHPTLDVLARLQTRGIEIRRTDEDGRIQVLGRRDGRFEVRTEGP